VNGLSRFCRTLAGTLALAGVALLVLGVASIWRVLNLEVHLQRSYEFGIGGARVYFAEVALTRRLRPPGWGIRWGEDHWDYRPSMATFLFDVPISVPFALLMTMTWILRWRSRRSRECPACGSSQSDRQAGCCTTCGILLQKERLEYVEARNLTLLAFPFVLAGAAAYIHGVLCIVFRRWFWFDSDLVIAAWIALVGTLAFICSRQFYRWCRWIRIESRRCSHCGYDLTGNVSGRCPECGEPLRPPARILKTEDVDGTS